MSQHCNDDDDDDEKQTSVELLKHPETLRLILGDQATVLDDSTPLNEYPIKEDCVIYVVFPVSDSEWESIDVMSTDMQDS